MLLKALERVQGDFVGEVHNAEGTEVAGRRFIVESLKCFCVRHNCASDLPIAFARSVRV